MPVALIGVGRWGANIKRTLETMGVPVVTFDKDTVPSPASLAAATPVIIATPGSTHAATALPFIAAGHPVFIEKPMTTNLTDARRLEQAARADGGQVFVGHVHLYNPAYLKTKELVAQAGKISYVSCEAMSWGPFRDDMSTLWDWLPHDVALALDLFGWPQSVQAWGNYTTTVAQLTFKDLSVFMHTTTLSPTKRKNITIVGEKYTVIFDDARPEQKVMVWRDGKVSYPAYEPLMPLQAEIMAFMDMVATQRAPKTDVANGFAVVTILDAIEQSVKQSGLSVLLPDNRSEAG